MNNTHQVVGIHVTNYEGLEGVVGFIEQHLAKAREQTWLFRQK
jgi:hypothetical protein